MNTSNSEKEKNADKKIGVKRVGDRELSLKIASENLIFLTVCPVAQKYGKDEQEKTSNYQ